jgi:hypothetical protein
MVENHKTRTKQENSSGAAELSETSFGLPKSAQSMAITMQAQPFTSLKKSTEEFMFFPTKAV